MTASDDRLEQARRLIAESRDRERERATSGAFDDGRTHANGCVSGLDRALRILDGLDGPE